MADRRTTTHRPTGDARRRLASWDAIAAAILAENEHLFGIAPRAMGGDPPTT